MTNKKKEKVGLIENLLIGSDCEWFLQDKKNGTIISAEGLIKGTKDEPFKFAGEESFFATSLDNVLFEGNIPPASTVEEFLKHFDTLKDFMSKSIPKTLKMLSKGSARLDYGQLQTDNAKTFGCALSYNAWTEEPEYVAAKKGSNLRGAGLHLHTGYTDPSYETNMKIIKAMDLFLSVPGVLIEPKDERKKVGYGKAGNHRHAPYGVEYRSLSSYFASTNDLLAWCFLQTQDAIKFVNDQRIEEINGRGEEIQTIINKNDKKGAQKLVNEFKLELI